MQSSGDGNGQKDSNDPKKEEQQAKRPLPISVSVINRVGEQAAAKEFNLNDLTRLLRAGKDGEAVFSHAMQVAQQKEQQLLNNIQQLEQEVVQKEIALAQEKKRLEEEKRLEQERLKAVAPQQQASGAASSSVVPPIPGAIAPPTASAASPAPTLNPAPTPTPTPVFGVGPLGPSSVSAAPSPALAPLSVPISEGDVKQSLKLSDATTMLADSGVVPAPLTVLPSAKREDSEESVRVFERLQKKMPFQEKLAPNKNLYTPATLKKLRYLKINNSIAQKSIRILLSNILTKATEDASKSSPEDSDDKYVSVYNLVVKIMNFLNCYSPSTPGGLFSGAPNFKKLSAIAFISKQLERLSKNKITDSLEDELIAIINIGRYVAGGGRHVTDTFFNEIDKILDVTLLSNGKRNSQPQDIKIHQGSEEINWQKEVKEFEKTLKESSLPFCAQASSETKREASFHVGTETGIVLNKGRKSTQEDRVTVGELRGFEDLDDTGRKQVLKNTVATLQKEVEEKKLGEGQGSTLSVVVACDEKVYTANVGDSAAYIVLIDDNGNIQVNRLTKNLHDIHNQQESKRIKDNKGAVASLGVFGSSKNPLSVTRAIGDDDFNKENAIISHEPEIYVYPDDYKRESSNHQLQARFIINGSDGFTEAVIKAKAAALAASPPSSADPASVAKSASEAWIKRKLEEMKLTVDSDPQAIATQLVAQALQSTLHSTDNVSLCVTRIDLAGQSPRYTGVFDGHGGDRVAQHLNQQFDSVIKTVVDNASKHRNQPVVQPAPKPSSSR